MEKRGEWGAGSGETHRKNSLIELKLCESFLGKVVRKLQRMTKLRTSVVVQGGN